MGRHATKTPRSQAAAASPEPDAEAAVAPASEVPEATAEATAERPGDDDLGGDSGAAAASSPAPEQHVGRADEPAAEDAGGAMVAAPTQTMAGVFPSDSEDPEEEDSEDDEEAEERTVAMAAVSKPSGKPKGKGASVATAAPPRARAAVAQHADVMACVALTCRAHAAAHPPAARSAQRRSQRQKRPGAAARAALYLQHCDPATHAFTFASAAPAPISRPSPTSRANSRAWARRRGKVASLARP